jgi:hypothetical protein
LREWFNEIIEKAGTIGLVISRFVSSKLVHTWEMNSGSGRQSKVQK